MTRRIDVPYLPVQVYKRATSIRTEVMRLASWCHTYAHPNSPDGEDADLMEWITTNWYLARAKIVAGANAHKWEFADYTNYGRWREVNSELTLLAQYASVYASATSKTAIIAWLDDIVTPIATPGVNIFSVSGENGYVEPEEPEDPEDP